MHQRARADVSGLRGLQPKDPIGVAVTCGSRGPSGQPIWTDRFHLRSPRTYAHSFGNRTAPARDPHPAFQAWTAQVEKLGDNRDRKPVGRLGVMHGNIVHDTLAECALWKRAAQKLPAPNPNPPSRRPACEGNGIHALRFVGIGADQREQYDPIPCPNRECEFAIGGDCHASGDLIFRLWWDSEKEWERQFVGPGSLLAHWHTNGWDAVQSMLGLFELVVGTAALLTPEERAAADEEERAKWRPGLAASLGIENPSLVGLPFTMTVGARTSPKEGGRRYTVVDFSPRGNLVEWLLMQRRQREELGAAPARLALPAMTVRDPEFEELQDDARAEFHGSSLVLVAEKPIPVAGQPRGARQNAPVASPAAPGPTTPPGDGEGAAYMEAADIAALYREGSKLGVSQDDILAELVQRYGEELEIPMRDRPGLVAMIQTMAKGGKR